jgi:hypothetical protein
MGDFDEAVPGKHPFLATLAHLLVAVVATWPAALFFQGRLVGDPRVDVWNHAWGPWWFFQSLSQGQLPLHTELLAAPVGGRLWFVDPIGALAGAPFVPLLGVAATWNLLIIGMVMLASIAGRRLARELGAGPRASWVGSVGLCCSPYLTSELHNGISEAVLIAPAVATLAALLVAFRLPNWRRFTILGLLAGLTALSTFYYAIGVAVVGLCMLPWLLHREREHWRALLPGLLLALTVALGIAVPAGLGLRWSLAHEPLVHRPDQGLAAVEWMFAHNAVDPRTFLWVGDFQSVDLQAEGEHFRHSSYLGIFIVIGALVSRRPHVLAAAVVGLLFSLGPWLWFDGAWLMVSGNRLALPYRLLLDVLPASSLTHPQRVGLPAIALLVSLAAVGAYRLPIPARLWMILLVAIDGLAVGPAPWPIARTAALDLSLHRSLPGRGAGIVLDLPADVGRGMMTSRYLVYQAAHGMPIPYKPDVRANTAALGSLPAFQALVDPLPDAPLDGPDPRGKNLADSGVRWVIVHRELGDDPTRTSLVEAQLSAWYGAAEVSGTHALFDTSRRPAPAE